MYVPGSPTNVKIGDTDTSLYLQVAKDNANVDLTSVKSITVKIADSNKNYLKDISISSSSLPDGGNGILAVPLNSDNVGGLNSGDYYFEVWIITADSETEIYPDMNVTKFHVFNNIVGGTSILTTLTMQAFLDRITANQNASETSLANSNAALTTANAANSGATHALNDLNAGNYLTEAKLSSSPTFEGLQTQVNNSAVGTNLLLGTTNNLATAQVTSYNGGAPTYTVNMVCSTATTFTARAWLHPYSHPTQVQIAWLDANNAVHYAASVFATVGSSGYSTCTFTIPTGGTLSYVTAVFDENETDKTQVDYKEFKLEKGSVATDWRPNPAEILTQSDYAKIKAAIVALGGSLS